MRLILANSLRALAQWQHACFAYYLQCDYLSRQSGYEKILYRKRSLLLSKLAHARVLLKEKSVATTKWAVIFTKIEHLSEIIFSLNQLRFRVSGYAIFEVCIAEMQALEKTSIIALKNLAQFILWHKRVVSTLELLDKVHAFEAISQRVLQVAAPEPIVFLFFIQDLYALYDGITELACKT